MEYFKMSHFIITPKTAKIIIAGIIITPCLFIILGLSMLNIGFEIHNGSILGFNHTTIGGWQHMWDGIGKL